MVKVYMQSVRQAQVCSDGGRLTIIGEASSLAFEGSPSACATFLRDAVPIGRSVAVRHGGGIRSCMNKPSLWADVASYSEGNA